MEGPSGQDQAIASSNASGVLADRRMCESPRQSMSDGGHSDYSTLAEREEVNDVVPEEPARITPPRPAPIRANQNRHRRQDSWMSNQLSPTGTVFDSLTREPIQLGEGFSIPQTDSPMDEKSFAPIPFPMTAAPAHFVHAPPNDIVPCYPTLRNRYDRKITV